MSLSPGAAPLGGSSVGLAPSSPSSASLSSTIETAATLPAQTAATSPFPSPPHQPTQLPPSQSFNSLSHLGAPTSGRSVGTSRSTSPWPQQQNQHHQPQQQQHDWTQGPTQLFVSNLPFRVRWQDMKDLFRKVGVVVRADVALTPLDGRSRGFGVVLFARRDDALKAIEIYNGFTWQTRVLDVKLDTQDPTGALAMAESNRQSALQQQAQQFGLNPVQSQWPGQMPVNLPFPVGMPPVPSPRGPGATSPAPPLAPPLQPSPPLGSSPSFPQQSPTAANGAPLQAPPQSDRSSLAAPPLADRGSSPSQQHHPMHQHPAQMHAQLGMHPISHSGVYQLFPGGGMGGPGGMNMMGGGGFPQQRQPSNQGFPPNRHLFVGNLPFNCQWQELKDLFRGAGAVLRADIAQGPEGRSRGFGSVVFSAAADAERAVQMFNGYDYNGRALKVHLDKFSGQGAGQPNPTHFVQQQHPNQQMQHHSFMSAFADPRAQAQQQQQQQAQHNMWSAGLAPPRGFDDFGGGQHSASSRPSSRNGFDSGRGRSDSHNSDQFAIGGTTISAPRTLSAAPNGRAGQQPSNNGDADDSSPKPDHHPSRITMPPPYPFSGPLSPLQGRLPPMTPSMPAFTLGAFPQTPPLYPQFFSPGLGPFSPGLGPGSPFFGSHHPFANAAPGAPLHGGFGSFGNMGMDSNGAHEQSHDHEDEGATPSAEKSNGHYTEPSYFPPTVAEPNDNNADEHTTPPALHVNGFSNGGGAHSAPPMSPKDDARPDMGTQSKSDSLASSVSRLTINAAPGEVSEVDTKLDGWATSSAGLGLGAAVDNERARRRSFVAVGATQQPEAGEVRRAFEGDDKTRRASFEAGSRARPAFGTSIWGDE